MIIVCNFFNQTSKMKLPIAVLSSILLTCSVTIANPVVPSTTASTEHVSLTAAPSSTTSTESNPSATPNTDGVNLDSLVSLSVDMKSLLKKIVKKQHIYNQQKITCEETEIKSYKQQKKVKLQKIKVEKSKNALLKSNGNGDDDDNLNAKLQEIERNLQSGSSILVKLEKSEKECNNYCDRLLRELNLLREELLKYFFGESWDSRPLDEQLSHIDSNPIVREYLQGICVGKSSECKNSFGQDSDAKQTPQQEQQQITQELPVMPPESRSFGQRASSGIREGFSRLGHRFRSFVNRIRRIN
ncbi:hypothetical protein QVD99_003186 [Batrachochytrium dendrobatidis]|nr:hypothetical protein QVD99_003186 [Batrachochytrium dendrobatidis]